ncbi:hypothetical protein [aff. Roholtiella sp. LEGE 12411]|uniref:hypothetical protein n=1 Tax=aff. Roholtiella sp. LEGE 12411 TaxID=1828822 RepID=UPI00187F0CCC|nr:hypothetical protein [aff. Roholtiella sp. LEGE 12411]MBE9034775.1 hypothetical protein [aff. Roholtiella sp. LEGE 12411]
MKNSIPLWMEFLGMGNLPPFGDKGQWGMGHGKEATNAPCTMPINQKSCLKATTYK